MDELYVVELLLPSGKPFRRSKAMSKEDAEELKSQYAFSSRIVTYMAKAAAAVECETPATDRVGPRGSKRND